MHSIFYYLRYIHRTESVDRSVWLAPNIGQPQKTKNMIQIYDYWGLRFETGPSETRNTTLSSNHITIAILHSLSLCGVFTAKIYIARLRLQSVNLSFLQFQKRHLNSCGPLHDVALFFILLTDLKTDPIDVEKSWSSGAHPSFPALYLKVPAVLRERCLANRPWPSTHRRCR